ncbi:MAG: DUF3307 domain-containing protein [Caldilineaceae bacterium]
MHLVAALFLAHLVGDFPLQTDWIYKLKTERWTGIALHSLIHVLATVPLITAPLANWPLLVTLGVTHFVVDFVKVRLPNRYQTFSFVADQLVHVLVILAVASIWSASTTAILPLNITIPLIIYGIFLGTLVFLWVLAIELSQNGWGEQQLVAWARQNLLRLSQYAGIPLLLLLCVQWYRVTEHPS